MVKNKGCLVCFYLYINLIIGTVAQINLSPVKVNGGDMFIEAIFFGDLCPVSALGHALNQMVRVVTF
jgi:hypothetical protein